MLLSIHKCFYFITDKQYFLRPWSLPLLTKDEARWAILSGLCLNAIAYPSVGYKQNVTKDVLFCLLMHMFHIQVWNYVLFIFALSLYKYNYRF